MTRSRSTCASPKLRTPGVSMTQPPPGSSRAIADDEVCRPRPVTALTPPVARSAPGTSALTSVDFPTPECPTSTLTRSAQVLAQLVQRVLAVDHDMVDVERAVGLEQRLRRRQVGLGQAEQRPQTGVVRRHQAPVDQPRPRLRVGQGRDDDELVGVGHDDPLERVGVVGRAAQRRGARLDPDDPGQGVRRAGHVADQCHPVADDDAAPTELAGLHRGHLVTVDPAGEPPAVDGDHDADRGVLVGRPVLGARPGPAAGPDPDVVLVQVAAARWTGRSPRASRSTARRSRASSWRSSRRPRPRRRARTGRGPPPSSPAGGRRTSRRHRRAAGAAGPQPVVGLAHVAAERVDLGGERGQPVGLVVAQVGDAAQPGRPRGQRRHRREHRRELADVAEVDVDALDPARSGDRQAVGLVLHARRRTGAAGRAARRRPGSCAAASPGR